MAYLSVAICSLFFNVILPPGTKTYLNSSRRSFGVKEFRTATLTFERKENYKVNLARGWVETTKHISASLPKLFVIQSSDLKSAILQLQGYHETNNSKKL